MANNNNNNINNNDKKKYNRMEQVLQHINKNFVTVSDEDAKKANPILKHCIETIIAAMKKVNPLFNTMYESILYGGSYFDGLKVGKPEEFDIDLKLVLPKLVAPKLCLSQQPGFVTIQLTGWSTFEKSTEFAKYKGLEKFKDEKDYLLVNKVLQWIESVAVKAMNEIGIKKDNNKAQIPYEGKVAEVALKKSGPAVTALITYGDIYMDVDLVAVFKLTADLWPPSPFKPLPKECISNGKKEFLIVPKAPKVEDMDKKVKERCWRMSFQEQEKVLIMGNNTCKPALRLIKKLRDAQCHTMISSYFIKTVFLHEIEKQDKQFWNAPLGYIFMHMLKTYRDCLSNYNIPYYWNKNNNLVKQIDKIVVDNFKNYLNNVIDTIEKKMDEEPYIIGTFLCTTDELQKLKQVNFVFGRSKSTGQENLLDLSIPGCSHVDNTVSSSSLDEVDFHFPLPKENKNDNMISILYEIQRNITLLQKDMKTALNKISTLEQSVKDLKYDNDSFREILNIKMENNSENKKHDEDNLIEFDLLKTDNSANASSNSNSDVINKLENLEKTVQNLKIENHILKVDFEQTKDNSENLVLINKLELLERTVQGLQAENDVLKSGLRQFVL